MAGRLRRLSRVAGGLAPVRALAGFYDRRPFLAAWLFLACGMGLAVVVFGRDVGLTAAQHATLVLLCLPLALLCTWIVSLETGSDSAPDGPG